MLRPRPGTRPQCLIPSLVLALALLCFTRTAVPQTTALSPQQLFKRMAPSVFVVEAISADGSVFAFGSGVAVAPSQVVTNRHVIADAVSLRVRQGERTWLAIVTHLDADHDLCRLKVEGLNASPVEVRRSSSLQVGERVYAIGAPKGLELTLSEGLISGLREAEGASVIQTTAPISKGSSGGGLFDIQGQLVGITTFYVSEGQNLNFALPGDWVLALDSHPILAGTKAESESADFQALLWYQHAYEAQKAGKFEQAFYAFGNVNFHLRHYLQAVSAYREAVRLKPDYADAWYNLGNVYVLLGQYQQAVDALREAVRLSPNNAGVRCSIGTAYARLGRPQQAVDAYRESIRLKPDYSDAWYSLGTVYGEMSQYQQEIDSLSEAIRLKPDHADAWYNLGFAYSKQGSRSKVMEVHQRLTTLDPKLADEFFQKVVLP